MKNFIQLILAMFILGSCATAQIVEKTPQYKVTIIDSAGPSQVIGSVKDKKGEPLPFAKVMLIRQGVIKYGAFTDLDGNFKLENIVEGVYDFEVNSMGYEPILMKALTINASTKIDFEMLVAKQMEIITLKPVIYLYPESELDVSVSINYNGKLTHTYPKYPENGWKVKALPDGTLFDEKGMEYYALFWEGKPTNQIVPENGFVISGAETAPFLEEKLAELALNRREANEFIMFWLPQLEKNPFNLIHFSGEAYAELAELNVTPLPETVIRVMMIYKPLQTKIDFPVQDISNLKKTRKGFTLVEWGGSIFVDKVN